MADGYNPGAYGGEIYVGHPQYGGGSAGANYYHALSGIGNDIARGMMYYHQQHVKYDQAAQLADALSRIGISPDGTITQIQMDEKGKPLNKDVRPVIDKKSLEMFQANNQRQRVANTAALDALGKLGIKQLDRALNQSLQDSGLTGDLKRARKNVADSRYAINQLTAAKMLGKLPPVPPVPTGSAVLAEQRALRKERFSQRKTINDSLTNQGIMDPHMLLSGVKFNVPTPGKIYGTNDNFIDATTDDSGNITIPKGATQAVIDDGTDSGKTIPIKSFSRMYQQAQEWNKLGQNVPAIRTPPPHDMQILLQDPSDQRKALFDNHYGQGAADLVLSAQDNLAKQQTPQPDYTPPPAGADEADSSGEEPPPEEPSDAGGE